MSKGTKMIRWNGWSEFIKKLCSVRFVSAGILAAALVCAMATGIDRFMSDTQVKITPWMAPHFFDNKFFVTFYGFVVCFLYSDVPFMNRSELYFTLRKGRRIWCSEKIFVIVMQAFSLTALTYLAAVLVFVPRLQFETGWGKIIHSMAFSNNIWDYNIFGRSSPVIVTKYNPMQAMLICFFMVWAVSSMMGLLMFVISLYWNRIAAVSVAVVLTGLNMGDETFITSAWLPYVTPFNWCRIGIYDESIFLDSYYPSLHFCLGLCGILLVVTILGIMFKSRHMEYVWNKEE